MARFLRGCVSPVLKVWVSVCEFRDIFKVLAYEFVEFRSNRSVEIG